jgi:hypothetical protein
VPGISIPIPSDCSSERDYKNHHQGNRFKNIIGKLVNTSQSAFIPDRSSAENIILAQETLHYLHTRKGKKGYMIVKVDLEKAYDRVSWTFLRNILDIIGLSEKLANLLMYCIQSSKLSVLWNGEKLESFSPSRGIRQGDPIAPYLFVLCMEVLSMKIVQAKIDILRFSIISSCA